MPSRQPVQPPTFGNIPGVNVGNRVFTMGELKKSGVHPGGQRVHFDKLGVYSLIVSQKDIDVGDSVTIVVDSLVGHRDRRRRQPPLVTPQVIESFKLNYAARRPVRVVRSFRCPGQYSPLDGHRYEGLYNVRLVSDDQPAHSRWHNWYVHLQRQKGQRKLYEDEPIPPVLYRIKNRHEVVIENAEDED